MLRHRHLARNISLGENSNSGIGGSSSSELLTKIIKAWILIASIAVLKASKSTLIQYKDAKIPILSIHGDKDELGKRK
jgi:hypothetical protein